MNRAQVWLDVLGKKEFPREVGISPTNGNWFSREEVHNPQEYVQCIKNNLQCDVYASLYSIPQIRSNKFDKVIIDIDKTVKDSYKTMKYIKEHTERKYGVEPYISCSGGKGYHVIIYFEEDKFHPRAVKGWLRGFTDEAVSNHADEDKVNYRINMIDTTVFGDQRQLFRLPYTMNHGDFGDTRFCSLIEPDWDLDKIKDEILSPDTREVRIESTEKVTEELKELSEHFDGKDCNSDGEYQVEDDTSRYAEELNKLMEEADKVGDGRRRILNFLVVPRLVALDKNIDEVRSWCKEWLNETGKSITEYSEYIGSVYDRTKEGNGDEYWRPWNFETFFVEHTDILEEFDGGNDG